MRPRALSKELERNYRALEIGGSSGSMFDARLSACGGFEEAFLPCCFFRERVSNQLQATRAFMAFAEPRIFNFSRECLFHQISLCQLVPTWSLLGKWIRVLRNRDYHGAARFD